jgi:hypothetical protein
MYNKFFINEDDIAMCSATTFGTAKCFAMSDRVPVVINPAETLPGKAREVTKEEFLKIANPDSVAFLERYLDKTSK